MTHDKALRDAPTGWPSSQDKIYRVGESIRLGTLVSEYNAKTKKWEPVAICR